MTTEHPWDDLCWFHGEEPVPDDCYLICIECGHAWTEEALVEADGRGIPADDIYTCPLCIHDF